MHLFILDKNYVTVKRYDCGYLMQYSDNVDMVFVAFENGTEKAPEAVAVLTANSRSSDETLARINLDWTSFEYQKRTYWGYCATIPSTFTQISGPLVASLCITTPQGAILYSQKLTLTVEPSALKDAWQHSMNYAQWKELISYFFNGDNALFPITSDELSEILV